MISQWPRPPKQPFWQLFRVNLHEFFDGLWGVLRYNIFNYAPNNKGTITQVLAKNLNKKYYIGALIVTTSAIQEFARLYPDLGSDLKEMVNENASHTSIGKIGDKSIESKVLRPFIELNFPNHFKAARKEKTNETTVLCDPPVSDSLSDAEFRVCHNDYDRESGP